MKMVTIYPSQKPEIGNDVGGLDQGGFCDERSPGVWKCTLMPLHNEWVPVCVSVQHSDSNIQSNSILATSAIADNHRMSTREIKAHTLMSQGKNRK